MTSEEIRATVDHILNHAQTRVTVAYAGERKTGFDGKPWPNDAWRVTFTSSPREHSEEFDFFTGLGLRAEPTAKDRILARSGT